MAVKMRLRREGKKKQPYYRVVVADARFPRDGRYNEDLGYYHPLAEPSEISIDSERALYWLRNGAQPSDAVRRLLRIQGIWEEFKPGDPGKDRSAKNAAKAKAKKGAQPDKPAEAAVATEAPKAAETPEPAEAAEADAAPAEDTAEADAAPAQDTAEADAAPAEDTAEAAEDTAEAAEDEEKS